MSDATDKPPTPTERIARAAVAAHRAAREDVPSSDNDAKSIAALASIVNRALLLVGLVVLVLGGLVGVGVTLKGMGTTVTTTTGVP